MSRNIAWLCPALGLAMASSGWAQGDKVTIKHAWPPGKYVMSVTNQSEGATTIAGNKAPSKDDSKQIWQMVVPAQDQKDEKKVTLQLAEAATEGEDDGETYRFDSAGRGRQNGELAFAFKPLMSASVNVTLDADDTVIEVTGLDKLWNSLSEKARTPAEKAVAGQFKIAMGDKFFETNFRRFESILPKGPVSIGDTWKAGLRLDLPLVGEIKARYDCKLAAVQKVDDGQVAVIEASSKYNLSRPKAIQMEGADVTLTALDMEETAVLKVNLQTGLLFSDETTRTVSIRLETPKEGKDIEITNKGVTRSKTTFTLAGKDSGAAAPPKESKPADRQEDPPRYHDPGEKPEEPAALDGAKQPARADHPLAGGAPTKPPAEVRRDAAVPGSPGGPAGLPPMIGQPNAAAPPWVKEGVRLVYYTSAGHMPGPNSYYRDATGDWVDKQGNRLTKTGSTGGDGCSQLDVLAVDGPAVIAAMRSWSYAQGTGPLYPIGGNGYIFLPGESEWWMNPAALRELPDTPLGELKIVRGPYKILRTGRVFDQTVVIRSEQPDSRIQHVYDAETGMLLHMDSSVRQRDGSLGVGRFDFLALRTVRLPWAGTHPPDWFSKFTGLDLQGLRTVQLPGVPASSMPTTTRVTVLRKGGTWALLNFDSRTQLPGGLVDSNQVQIVTGPNRVGALWIHPEVLRQLRAGQVLDQDETLGTRVAVAQVENGMAVINETGPAHSYNFGYDLATGRMAAQTMANQVTGTRVDLRCTPSEER